MKWQRVTFYNIKLSRILIICIILPSTLVGSIISESYHSNYNLERSSLFEQTRIKHGKRQGDSLVPLPKVSLAQNNSHNCISINGNADFFNQASEEGWSGAGTRINPYKIDGFLIIDNKTLIDIRNTDLYFQITNCFLIGSNDGIYFENVTLGTIVNNTIQINSSSINHPNNSEDIPLFGKNVFNNNISGIYLNSSSNINISNNFVSNYMNGVFLSFSENNTLSSNIISNNTGNGIYLSFSGNNTIFDNRLINNSVFIDGTLLDHFLQADVRQNLVNRKKLIYWNNTNGGIIPSGAGQIILVNSSSITITNQTLNLASVGLLIAFCSNIMIQNNNFTNNRRFGIFLFCSINTTLLSNVINCTSISGIHISLSRDVNISGNYISHNINGIDVLSSNNSFFSKNIIFNNDYGIHLYYSSCIAFSGNIIYNNKNSGIYLSFSGNNTIKGNHLVNNGVFMDGTLLDHFLQADVRQNLVNGKPLIYWNNTIGGVIPSGAGQIILVNSTSITVANQTLNLASVGLEVAFCSNISIRTNILSYNNENGLYFYNSINNTISNNTIIDNDIGISLYNSENNTIVNNSLSNNGLHVSGDEIKHFFQIKVSNNLINGKLLIYWQNVRNLTVPQSAGQVILINSTLIEVFKLNITNVPIGIFGILSSNITIYKNVIFNNNEGISFINSFNISIVRNIIVNNSYNGIKLQFSNNSNIINNSLSHNNFNGLFLHRSVNNTIYTNSIYNNGIFGVILQFSDKNVISKNILIKTYMYGINLYQSGNNTIKWNNFQKNNQWGDFQACDHDYKSQMNQFAFNYWENWRIPDADADGIVDSHYPVSGSSNNSDSYPMVDPNQIEIYLLSNPVIIFPNGREYLKKNILITWEAATGFMSFDIQYFIYYSNNGGKAWILLDFGVTDTEYEWNTTIIPDGFNFKIKVIAIDSGGLMSVDISDRPFQIINVVYTGVTLLKILIALNMVILLLFIFVASYTPLKKVYRFHKTKGLDRGILIDSIRHNYMNFIVRMKWILLAISLALLLSIMRAWLIDPAVVIQDGYQGYAGRLQQLLFNWTFEIDIYPIPKHQFRILYPLLIAIISTIVPIFDIILIGRLISVISFFIVIYYLSKILDRFKIFSIWTNKERVLIVFILNTAMVTNVVRLETDIFFLALSLYIIHQYLIFTSDGLNNFQKGKLILALPLLFFIREVGVLLILALLVHYFLSFPKKLKLIIVILLPIVILIGFLSNILQELLFYSVWNSSTYQYAYEIFRRNNWFAFIEMIFSKITDFYAFTKTIESLVYVFFPSAIFSFLGFVRFYRMETKVNQRKMLSSVITFYVGFYLLFYIIFKVGRGLDRFWIPILPFFLIFLPFCLDVGKLKTEVIRFIKQISDRTKTETTEVTIKESNQQFRITPAIFNLMKKISHTEEDISKSVFPKDTYNLILGTQIFIYISRAILSLVVAGVLPVYP